MNDIDIYILYTYHRFIILIYQKIVYKIRENIQEQERSNALSFAIARIFQKMSLAA